MFHEHKNFVLVIASSLEPIKNSWECWFIVPKSQKKKKNRTQRNVLLLTYAMSLKCVIGAE